MATDETCARCGGPTDTGSVRDEELRYLSDRQTGMMRRPTAISRARACIACGHVELFIDPAELRKNLGA
jgi:hypothetical protein